MVPETRVQPNRKPQDPGLGGSLRREIKIEVHLAAAGQKREEMIVIGRWIGRDVPSVQMGG